MDWTRPKCLLQVVASICLLLTTAQKKGKPPIAEPGLLLLPQLDQFFKLLEPNKG
jgi:hypothetical protein